MSYRIRRKDGTYTWFETVSRGIRDAQTGNVIEIQSASRDISERMSAREREREHEQQLFQASKLASLGTLVSGIAHEINNPNNYIRLNSQNLTEFWDDIRLILDEARFEGPGPHAPRHPLRRRRAAWWSELLGGIGEGSKRIEKLLLEPAGLRARRRGRPGRARGRERGGQFRRHDRAEPDPEVDGLLLGPGVSLAARRAGELSPGRAGGDQPRHERLPGAALAREEVTIATTIDDEGEWVPLSVSDEGIGIPPAEPVPHHRSVLHDKAAEGRIGSRPGRLLSHRPESWRDYELQLGVGQGTVVTVRLPVTGGAS